MPVCETLVDRIVVFDTSRNAGRNHHRTSLAAQLLLGNNLLVEMLHHHSSLLCDNVRIALDEGTQFFLRTLLIKHRIILDRLHELVPAVNGCIVAEHIQNEAFLNSLLHGVDMEWAMLDFSVLFIGNTKHLLGLILRCGCEGKVAGRRDELTSLHHGIDFVFIIRFVVCSKAGKCQIHIGRVTPALARMRLVNDNGKLVVFMFLPDLGDNVRELFNRRYNDALAILYGFA